MTRGKRDNNLIAPTRPTGPTRPTDRFAGRRVHVIGLGSYGTGREAARVLAARGAEVTVSDIKPEAELLDEIAALAETDVVVQAGPAAYRGLEQADLIVTSPGVPLNIPPLLRAASLGIPVVSEIEVAYWIAPCPIVAVTGTKGKSTTTTLIGEILRGDGVKVEVGGNIGRPLISFADRAAADAVLVAEVSSFQLEATREFRPRVAVLLNLFPDHLDRHTSMADYAAAKARLFANQQAEDTAVINNDDRQAWALRSLTRAQVVPFSLTQASPMGADVADGWLRVKGRAVCRADAVRLRGRHNLANALAALAAAHAAGASLNKADDTLSHFEGLEHRLEVAAVAGGVTYVNDSQATTPDAAVVALEAFPEHVILIAGGRPKVHDFDSLARAIAKRGADLVLIGEAADEIAACAAAAGVGSVTRAPDLEQAVALAARRSRPGDVVLLSPACASFDMFRNMAERGRKFKEIATRLARPEGSSQQ
ncbi:MAG: UDP-N-acetylmuramoyl-L-alanine--D-glutamate ligase [Armatimonadota bacterium]